ncbi:MAG: response regulator [Spirochaetaceae bacterium]|nr:response regulator [Spirochaetaceae bacterium]
MYKVFIVDDEVIVREGIRSKIDWDNTEFELAGEAADGEIALSMIQDIKPDILITDIKMPFMDGLELARMVKKIQPWIRIIILSGHDEFEYAKKAISIGIDDYLLKPFTAEDVLASMRKATMQIDKERKQLSAMTEMKEALKTKERLVQKEFLSDLVHGISDMSSVMQKSQELQLDLIARYYKIFITKIETQSQSAKKIQDACSLLNSYADGWDGIIRFFLHKNRMVCIVKSNTREEIEEKVYSIAETIEHVIKTNSECTVITAIGKTVDHLSLLKESYEDAKKIIEISNYNNQNRIISSDDLQLNSDELLELKENDPLVDRLKYAGKNEISALIEESMLLIKKNPGQFQVFASYLLVDLIFAVSKLVENLGGDIKTENPEILQRNFIENAVLDEDNFRKKMESILNFAVEFRDSKMTGRYGDVILKAKEYIDKNYADQNTTLTTVAEVVCLSPNHFSTIFSQECKTTFIEYLTNVRIENAKRLIRETDMKGYDIAYECGFSDPHYFSYIFKKNTGLSPREFKGTISSGGSSKSQEDVEE